MSPPRTTPVPSVVDAPSGAIPESAPPRDVDAWFREASSDEIETLLANRQLEQQP